MKLLYILPFVYLLSALIFALAGSKKPSRSWSVVRTKEKFLRIIMWNPWLFAIFAFALMTGALVGMVKLSQIYPQSIKWFYVYSVSVMSYLTLSYAVDSLTSWHGKWIVVVKAVLAIVLGTSWMIAPTWYIYNLVGVIASIAFLVIFPALPWKHAVALGGVLIAYDVNGVYISKWILQLVNMGFLPPAVAIIPKVVAAQAAPLAILGLGDIILGGVFLATATKYGLRKPALWAYFFALTCGYITVMLTHRAVPAMIFIVPAMLITTAGMAWYRGIELK